jgi:hypothetical protein
MTQIIDKAKNLFLRNVEDFGSDPYGLVPHVPEVEKWVGVMLRRYPQADMEIIMLAVWLHDLGHYPVKDADHAVTSERLSRVFLERENYPKERMERVLHCVRSHRCRDVMPGTIEAKILSFSDSASHLTDSMYLKMAKDDIDGNVVPLRVYAKMERDLRDISIFPEMKRELAELSSSWKALIKAFEKARMN